MMNNVLVYNCLPRNAMKNSVWTICIIMIISIYSCSKSGSDVYENARIITKKDFGKEITLKGEEVVFDEMIFRPYKMMIKDTILIIYNVDTEYAFQVFNLKSKKYIGESMLIGNGPNELLYPNFIHSDDDYIWLYDQEKSLVLKYDVETFIKKNKRAQGPLLKIKLDDRSENVSIINDKIFTYKMHSNLNNNRFAIFNMEGKYINTIGRFPNVIGVESYDEINEAFTSEYATNFKDRIFISYKLTDLIEIYDINGELITQLFGPDHFVPSVTGKSNGVISFAKGTDKTREASFNPANAGEEVFVTYSGELLSKNAYHKNIIHVFDWNGNPLRKYILDIPIYRTIVD